MDPNLAPPPWAGLFLCRARKLAKYQKPRRGRRRGLAWQYRGDRCQTRDGTAGIGGMCCPPREPFSRAAVAKGSGPWKQQRPPTSWRPLPGVGIWSLEMSLGTMPGWPSSSPEHRTNAHNLQSVPITRVMRVPLFCETDLPFSLRALPWLSTFQSSSLRSEPRNPVLLQSEPGLVFCLVRSSWPSSSPIS